MTLTEFSNIAKNKLSDKIINILFCIIAIALSLFFQIKFSKLFSLELSKTNYIILVLLYSVFVLLMLLGFCGLVALIRPLKVSCVKNEISRGQNFKQIEKICIVLNGKEFYVDNNTIQFTYKKSFWSYKHKINFLVDDNLIAVYVKNIEANPKGGFLDFGASIRLQKKVLKMIEEKASL